VWTEAKKVQLRLLLLLVLLLLLLFTSECSKVH
jgi:hypothetical protein